jgi:uncharacterized protein (TIGR04255 family)
MGQKMKKPPIFYTISQIQFSPILGMAKFIPEIQEALRQEFPDFRQEKIANFPFQIAGENALPPFLAQSERWHFIREDKTSGYWLKPESLVFHTTAYETSEHFLESILKGISVVNDAANLGYIESVSVRTLDAVVPDSNTTLDAYLNPKVQGLSQGFNGKLKQNVMESFWEFPTTGLLISRVTVTKGALAFPMDLFPLQLELKPELRQLNEVEHALLDNDRQEKQRFKFNLEEIRKKFLVVKKDATEAFEQEVTPFALERWR